MKTNKENQKELFSKRTGKYSGDTRAPAIKVLSKNYLKGKVLDIGAGSGALVSIISNAVGIDIVPKKPEIKEGDISNIPFKDDSFETVFALEVLEHLDDETLTKGMKEVRRVLTNGGYFIITTPYKENLSNGMALCPNCDNYFHKAGHVRSFDDLQLEGLLKENGFKKISRQILPLGSFGRHPFLKYFWKFFNFFGIGFKPTTIFLITEKIDKINQEK
jgi:SAM-dependent methyltransferase